MTIAVDRQEYYSSTDAPTHDIAFPLGAPPNGDLIIYIVDAGAGITTPGDLTRLSTATAINNTDFGIFVKIASGESASRTFTVGGTTSCAMHTFRIANPVSATPDKELAAINGSATTQTAGTTGTLSQSLEVALVCFALQGSGGPVVNSYDGGFAQEFQGITAGSVPWRLATASLLTSSTAGVGCTATLASTGSCSCLLATFSLTGSIIQVKPTNLTSQTFTSMNMRR